MREELQQALRHVIAGYRHQQRGEFYAAQRDYREAVRLGYADPLLINNAGVVSMMTGNLREGLRIIRKAALSTAAPPAVYSNYLCARLLDPAAVPSHLHRDHLRWKPVTPPAGVPVAARTRGRYVRIGYVSASFRRHAVMSFFPPLLTQRDRERFHVTCYSSTVSRDATTEWVQQHADQWRDVARSSDDDLERNIRSDEIDILVDLDGHFLNNRLAVFARKPAPVTATYLGYPFTTGLESIDYRITDARADPPGKTERWHAERLARIRSPFLAYVPAAEALEFPAASEKDLTEPVVFGCFGQFDKIGNTLLAIWKQILDRVPASILILKSAALADEGTRKWNRRRFARLGIDPDRIDLRPFTPSWKEHFKSYRCIDIALDTYPSNGTTTTCDALLMGVPVVALTGQTHHSRVGASLLAAVGRPSWATGSPAEYVETAVALGGMVRRLRQSRARLRERFLESPLCDGQRLVRNLERLFLAWADRHLGE